MQNAQYWKQRFKDIESAAGNYGQAAYSEVERAFTAAQHDIQKNIEAWYARYAKDNGVMSVEANRRLNSKELAELKWDIGECIKYGRENTVSGEWVKELEKASAKLRITRLEALRVNTRQALEKAFGGQLDEVNALARKTVADGYYRTIYEVQKGVGIGWDIAAPSERTIGKIIDKPWTTDGRTFSDRIWSRKDQMIDGLNKELMRCNACGYSTEQAVAHIRQFIDKNMTTAKHCAARLIRTELAYFHSASQREALEALGVEEFEVVLTIDGKSCQLCRMMNGKHFPMSQYEIGTTVPPFHPNCDGTTAPYFDGDFEAPEDKEAVPILDNMSYGEWKKAFVDGDTSRLTNGGDGGIIKTIGELKINSQPHDILSDLKDTNPNYSKGGGYKKNCGNCAVTFELRRRGYDVEARPSNGLKANEILGMFNGFNPLGYMGEQYKQFSKEDIISDIIQTAKGWGNGSRGIVNIQWNGCDFGHFFSIEVEDGNVRFINPQDGGNAIHFFDSANILKTVFGRTDNLDLTDNVLTACKNKE